MDKLTGKKLLESFMDGGCPVRLPVTNEHKVRAPVIIPDNPKRDVPIPETMKDLPLSDRGYVVPFFVSWINGQPDFRCVQPGTVVKCVRNGLCWVCGQPHDRDQNGHIIQTYVIGPMCSINHLSAEPGSHLECARYSVRVCPFLTAPKMVRNEKSLPEDTHDPGGMFITRNPGAMILWTTSSYSLVPTNESPLFRLGEPSYLEFWREGRYATHAEVMESIRTGLPILQEEADRQGPLAQHELKRMVGEAITLIQRFI